MQKRSIIMVKKQALLFEFAIISKTIPIASVFSNSNNNDKVFWFISSAVYCHTLSPTMFVIASLLYYYIVWLMLQTHVYPFYYYGVLIAQTETTIWKNHAWYPLPI